jgi:hypothetical protein
MSQLKVGDFVVPVNNPTTVQQVVRLTPLKISGVPQPDLLMASCATVWRLDGSKPPSPKPLAPVRDWMLRKVTLDELQAAMDRLKAITSEVKAQGKKR